MRSTRETVSRPPLISFISIHVAKQKIFYGQQLDEMPQTLLVWSGDIISVETFLCHRMIGLQGPVCSLQCAALSAGDRTGLSRDRACQCQWPVVEAGPQCTSLPGHRPHSAPDFSLKENSNSWLWFTVLCSLELYRIAIEFSSFFFVYIWLVHNTQWMNNSGAELSSFPQTSLCPQTEVRGPIMHSSRRRTLTSSWE